MAIANTSIRIRKSLVGGVSPSSLANGEIAINQVDGKLFYSTPSGGISSISNQQTFATINASGSLILAGSSTDTLTFASGSGILVSGNPTTKTISQSVTGYVNTLAPFTTGTLTSSAFGTVVQLGANATLPLANSCPTGAGGKIAFYSQGTYTITVASPSTNEFIYSGTGGILTTSTRTVTLFEGETLELTTRGSIEWDVTGGTGLLKYQPQANVRVIAFQDGTTQSTAAGGAAIDQYARTTANTAGSNTVYTFGVDASQNTRLGTVEANTIYLFGALNQTNTNLSTANTFLQANDLTTLIAAQTYTNNQLSANTLYISGVDSAQNTRLGTVEANTIYINGVDAAQNTRLGTVEANTIYISGVDAAQNTRLGTVESNTIYLFGALNTANSNALPNVGSIISVNSSSILYVTNLASSISNSTGALIVNGGAGISGNVYIGGIVYANSASNNYFSGSVGIGIPNPVYKLQVNGSFAATTKSFVIDHPTKTGKKLRYGSLEGPENGVYVRGQLEQMNIIELPDYWSKLVDKNSITVHLTPIGNYQNLFVKDIIDNTIIIGNSNDNEIDCFYTVYAERIDVEKLEVEIDGS